MSENGSSAAACSIKLTCDVGGTFTDVVLSDTGGRVAIGKAMTTPQSLIEGLLTAIGGAGAQLGLERRQLLEACELFVYSTTQATNAILEHAPPAPPCSARRVSRTFSSRREGGSMHLYDFRRPFPDPYVPRHLTFEIPERIGAEGDVVVAARRGGARDDPIAGAGAGSRRSPSACCGRSPTRSTSCALGELLEEAAAAASRTRSRTGSTRSCASTAAPRATAIDASLKPLMQEHLREIEAELREAGFAGELLVATSRRRRACRSTDWPSAPIYAVSSGPSLAPVAGRAYGDARARRRTTRSSATRAGRASTSAWSATAASCSRARPGSARRSTATSPASRRSTCASIGAGGGSIAWIDAGGLLRVGPQSAGADPGPGVLRARRRPADGHRCRPGARLPRPGLLPRRARCSSTRRRRGRAIGDARRAARAVGSRRRPPRSSTVANEQMVAAIQEITVNEGVDPRESVLVAGGGAAGLNDRARSPASSAAAGCWCRARRAPSAPSAASTPTS